MWHIVQQVTLPVSGTHSHLKPIRLKPPCPIRIRLTALDEGGVDVATRRVQTDEPPKRRRRAASTPEARETQVVAAAIDLAERQIREGTASSQVITHFLKLGSTTHQLEQEKLRRENELLSKRVETLESGKELAEKYDAALQAMRRYQGIADDIPDDEYFD